MSETKRDLSFKSPKEFNSLCHDLSMYMHYKNRVALGESGFVAELAIVIERVGQAFEKGLENPEIGKKFGGAYLNADLSKQEQTEAVIGMLFPARRA